MYISLKLVIWQQVTPVMLIMSRIIHKYSYTSVISFRKETTSTTSQLYSCFIRRFIISLLTNLRMKQLYNWDVVELVSLLNVICTYSWALSAIASCNHYTSSKLPLLSLYLLAQNNYNIGIIICYKIYHL